MKNALFTIVMITFLIGCTNKSLNDVKDIKPKKLEFRETYTNQEMLPYWTAANSAAKSYEDKHIEQLKVEAKGFSDNPMLLKHPMLKDLITDLGANSFCAGVVEIDKKKWVDSILAIPEVKAQFPEDLEFMWSNPEKVSDDSEELKYMLYATKKPSKRKARLGNEIERVSVDNFDGQYSLAIKMTEKGSDIWHDITQQNINRIIAICIDGTVYSAPKVMTVISGGNTQISGSFTKEEAEELKRSLEAGLKINNR